MNESKFTLYCTVAVSGVRQ